ncbi:hypothetical protein J3R30DRAFT_3475339 [Lentinula aciculospora]|uniref:Uncharacterized protein n=1 Tax=Lentinula aciculospora TaxID=153920 RepID=A0A9W9AEJ2_9AGAR|nr:hypothetical protein J3R30DRAFT_3475339 [Lentinula aciculospora]
MEDVNAFSIATFRERDKAIQRKHSEEIHRYKVALDKSNYVNAGLRTSLFDLKNRSNRLVQSLGFGDLMEAQVYVDAEQSEIKYRDLLRLVESLEGKLKESKALIAKMENKEKELEEKYTVIRKTKDESVYAHRLLVKEHQNLQDMHNDTVKSNNAAAERRQKDYEKWTHFKRWILCLAEIEQFKKYEKELGLDKVERKERAKELFRAVTRKKYKLSQLDSLQDETLFDLVEQDSNESRLFATAPNIRILDNASKPSPITPLNPSSKANNPANDHNPSSSPFLDPNTAAIQPQRLIRSYAIKNTTTSPPMMVESDLSMRLSVNNTVCRLIF